MEKLLEQFSLGLFFWQTLLFVGLIFLLKKFAWKPILEAVNTREQGIKGALLSAENAKRDMQNLKADNEKLLAEARAERDALMKEAREIKEKMIADAKVEAQVQSEKLIANAKASIDAEKHAVLADIKSQVSTLSIEIAEKILKGELADVNSQTKLVDKLLDEAKLN